MKTANDNWINFADKKPEKEGDYLCLTKYGSFQYDVLSYEDDGHWYNHNSCVAEQFDKLWWQPLPDKPEE